MWLIKTALKTYRSINVDVFVDVGVDEERVTCSFHNHVVSLAVQFTRHLQFGPLVVTKDLSAKCQSVAGTFVGTFHLDINLSGD